jgi:hypothetical protein
MTKGIISPWAKAPEIKPEEQEIAAPESRLDEAPPLPVRFPGQGYNIQVGIVLPKKVRITPEQGEKFGKIVLGAAIKELFQKAPGARQVFLKQEIYTQPPLGPKVTVELGEHITLYAKASSSDLDLAVKMTVDRIVYALMECRTTFKVTNQILKDYRVDTVLKGTP